MDDKEWERMKQEHERVSAKHEFKQETRELNQIYYNHCDTEELLWCIEYCTQILKRKLILKGAIVDNDLH